MIRITIRTSRNGIKHIKKDKVVAPLQSGLMNTGFAKDIDEDVRRAKIIRNMTEDEQFLAILLHIAKDTNIEQTKLGRVFKDIETLRNIGGRGLDSINRSELNAIFKEMHNDKNIEKGWKRRFLRLNYQL